MCARDIEITYFYDFPIECWYCSDIVSLKGDIVLPWDRQVLGEWNHLFFFTYEIRNVPFNIQYYITIILLDLP
jgi:hypothetical protein